VSAIDVGIPINPLTLEPQTQGGVIDGLSAALQTASASARRVPAAPRDTDWLDDELLAKQRPARESAGLT
jgi:CO/xanthine dehydrogenase Mo-binding subunit